VLKQKYVLTHVLQLDSRATLSSLAGDRSMLGAYQQNESKIRPLPDFHETKVWNIWNVVDDMMSPS
jgi:hypothetical protein